MTKTQFGYRRHPDQDRAGANIAEHPVVVVGAGPVGLSLAIDLAQRGQSVVLLDDADRIGEGSRAICFSKRSLEFWDRLGIGQRMVDKGVVWSVGKIFHGELAALPVQPAAGGGPQAAGLHQPAAILCRGLSGRPRRRASRHRPALAQQGDGLEQRNDHVALTIETPDGPYRLAAQYVVACDGARSSLRQMVGAEFAGQVFEDQFLIADVKMTAAFPTERWFWFDPPFHAGRSALLHKQPDDIWRIDLQLNRDADPAVEKLPENVRPRIARMLGHDKFDFEWISLYKFQCRRMDRFIHGRVIFAGDAAHQVSPFGARGANSGLEDAEKSGVEARSRAAREIAGGAARELSHRAQRRGGREHPRITRSTDFMAPNSQQEARLRKAVLSLAKETEFGKRMVNGGRLSVPSVYETPLSTADSDSWRGGPRPGASMLDAPVAGRGGGPMFLTEAFIGAGTRFTLLEFGNGVATEVPEGVGTIRIGGEDGFPMPQACRRALRCRPGRAYLLRPDGYVAARFRIRRVRRSMQRWRAAGSIEVSSWRCRPLRTLPSPMTRSAPSSRRIAD